MVSHCDGASRGRGLCPSPGRPCIVRFAREFFFPCSVSSCFFFLKPVFFLHCSVSFMRRVADETLSPPSGYVEMIIYYIVVMLWVSRWRPTWRRSRQLPRKSEKIIRRRPTTTTRGSCPSPRGCDSSPKIRRCNTRGITALYYCSFFVCLLLKHEEKKIVKNIRAACVVRRL